MILTVAELMMIKPLMALVERAGYTHVELVLSEVGLCKVTLEVSVNGILLRKDCSDSPPVLELYRTAMGLAQAYRVPLALVSPTEED